MKNTAAGTVYLFLAVACGDAQHLKTPVVGGLVMVAAATAIVAANHEASSNEKDKTKKGKVKDSCFYDCADGAPCHCSGVRPANLSNDDKYKFAATVAGINIVAEVIRTAKRVNPQNIPVIKTCCTRCPAGYFPCGDGCHPIGCLPPCLEPPGCACYDGEDPESMPPMGPPAPAENLPVYLSP